MVDCLKSNHATNYRLSLKIKLHTTANLQSVWFNYLESVIEPY